jgi:nucleotide-binding universal stress UspA family protein
MYKHILIGTDGSELSKTAETTGLKLAQALGAQVTAVTVTQPWEALSMAALAERGMPNPIADYDERVVAAAQRILWRRVSEEAKNVAMTCTVLYMSRTGTPPRGLSRPRGKSPATSSFWRHMAGGASRECFWAARQPRW